MNGQTLSRCSFLALLLLGAARPAVAAPGPVNLLLLPSARIEQVSPVALKAADLRAWTDGKPVTAAAVPASAELPVEIVFGFGGATVCVERIVVHLPSGGPPPRMEILVSTVSAQAGFQQLRAELLRATTQPQVLRVPQTAARWILFRFTPSGTARKIEIGELECLGNEGPPQSRYAFKETPADAIRVLSRLGTLSALELQISSDEKALFADVQAGKFRTLSMQEAAILASGVTDSAQRKRYLATFDRLLADARKATAKAKTPAEKGQLLLAWMHAGPLAKGYCARQTTLSEILDGGNFNCVSSAVLYNALALGLGLDARAVEVPDHAFSVVYSGSRAMDVETTTKLGFSPARDREAARQLEKLTGFRYIPDSHRDERREIREAGLVAIIYYNRGVSAMKEKRYHEALLHYFRAMSLDREFASAVKNALAVLGNWSVELARAGKFKDGLAVLAVGLELAPRDAAMLHNRKVFWSQWAERLAHDGKTDEALALLSRAAREVPAEAAYFNSQRSWVFLRNGEALVKDGKWDEASAAVAGGLKLLEGEPRAEIVRWQRDLPLRHSAALLRKDDHEGAVSLLAIAIKNDPKDERLRGNLCHAVQKWAWHVHEREGEANARQLLKQLLEKHGKVKGMSDVAYIHTDRIVKALLAKDKLDEARAAIERHAELFAKAEDLRDLIRSVTDRCAKKLLEKGQYLEALEIYDSALKRLANDDHLKNNRRYQMNQFIRAEDARGETKAIEALQGLRKRYPDEKALDDMARNQASRAAKRLAGKGKYEEALLLIDRHRKVLSAEVKAQDKAIRSLCCMIYDDWSGSYRKKKEWQKALDVYKKGLERFSGDSHLENNAVYVWDSWARTYFPEKKWAEAIKVYEQALKQFPKSSTLKGNLEYCKRQK
jgi:tetratricopeptide (TPR) repeat protein